LGSPPEQIEDMPVLRLRSWVACLRWTRWRALLLVLVTLVFLAWWLDAAGRWCRQAAQRSLRNNSPWTALKWIDRSRSIRGATGETYLLEARACARAGLNARAISALALATGQDVDSAALEACQDLVAAHRGDLAAAERLTTLRTSRLPDCEIYEAVVRCALFHGRWDWARGALAAWEKDLPRDAVVPYLRGRVRELEEQLEDALREYEAALRLQPTLAKAAFRRAVILRELRRFDEAVTLLQRCRGSPFDLIARIEVADCRWQQGDSDAAWEALEPALSLAPQYLMELYLQVEEYIEDDRAALVATRIRAGQDNAESVVPLAARVLDFNHRNIEARNLLVSALRRLGRTAEADEQTAIVEQLLDKRRQTTDLRRLLSENPNDLETRCDLAGLYLEAESLMHAQFELLAVLERSANHARAHGLLARVYHERARYAPAFSELGEYHDRFGR